jgi:O-antigen ligase
VAVTIALAGLVAIAQNLLGTQLEGGYALLVESRSYSNNVALSAKRSYGTLLSQAAFGVMSAIGVIASLAVLLLARNWRWQLIGSASLVLTGLGLLLSGTRSALLGLALGILPLLWLAIGDQVLRLLVQQRIRKNLLVVAIGLVIAGVILVGVLQTSNSETVVNVRERLATLSPVAILTGQVLQEQNFTTRVVMWQPILKGIAERPLLGYGTGVLGGGSELNRVGVKPVNGSTVADNQYLEIWGETGLLGLVFYLAVLIGMISSWFIWRTPMQVLILSSSVAGVALLVAVSSIGNAPIDYYPANAFFWLMAGIGANLPLLARLSHVVEQDSAHVL